MSNFHVWVKFDNPADVVRVRTASLVAAAEQGLTWLKPKYSSKTGQICGHSLTTIFDTSVLTPGRLVFSGKPTVRAGLKVNEPEFHINDGILSPTIDTSVLRLPNANRIKEITKAAGVEMHVSGTNGDLRTVVNDLSYETELETAQHGLKTVAEAMQIGGVIRCQSPFRESTSWAGMFSVGIDGTPHVFDFGTSTTHRLVNDAFHDFDPINETTQTQIDPEDVQWNQGESPFNLHSPQDLFAVPAISWLIKGILPAGGIGVLYGESGSGKTFIALDMAMHLVRGEEWQGKRVKPSGVLYLAAEGAAGLSLRLKAYSKRHELDLNDLPFFAITEAANLMEKGDKRLFNSCLLANKRLGYPIKMIIIDTLNRSMPGGDENSSLDMSTVIDRVARMANALGVFVLIIHHSGKDASKGARGHSSLRAAVDVELEVKRDGEIRTLTLTKSRDGQDGAQFANRLEIVHLGMDEDLDEITSCVAVSGLLSDAASKKPRPQGKWQELVYIAFNQSMDDAMFDTNPDQVSIEAIFKKLELLQAKTERWKESARKALVDLMTKGLVRQIGLNFGHS